MGAWGGVQGAMTTRLVMWVFVLALIGSFRGGVGFDTNCFRRFGTYSSQRDPFSQTGEVGTAVFFWCALAHRNV
ncbi:MAG: hypothetical protein ACI8TF_001493 [Paracoccaceae bacterium]|jgi:hypothetical protein